MVAIRAEYWNEREVADAPLKLGQLKYKGSIRTYMTEFRALNNFTQATWKGLREKVDMAIPDSILDMRFNQNLDDPVDDELFLQATYRASIQVEQKKVLKQVKKTMRATTAMPVKEGRKKGPNKGSPDNTSKLKVNKEARCRENRGTDKKESQYSQQGSWATKNTALNGMPDKKQEEYGRSPEDCWRCGHSGHRTYECFSFNTREGTTCNTRMFHQRHNRPGGHQQSITLEWTTLV